MTLERPLLVIVGEDATEEEWLEGRDTGVTASQAHAICQGGRGTWRRILTEKLNGATFKGNAHTRRGHEREPFLLQWATEHFGAVHANRALYGHPDNPRLMATPDGLGWHHELGGFGFEAKSHDHGWTRDDIPRDHMDQMLFGMYVLGFDRWLYVFEVMGEDGTPTLDPPQHIWVERNEVRIARLVAEAEAFLAWRDAGAPEIDDIPDDVEDALATWADARDRKNKAAADEKTAERVIRQFINHQEGADEHGLKRAGTRAHFTFAVTVDQLLDEIAWEAAEPESYAEWADLKVRVAEQAETARQLYSHETRTTRLNIYANKEQS